MNTLTDLEKLLDREITVYQEIEHNIKQKREALVKGDMDRLQKVDEKIHEYNNRMEEIIKNRSDFNKKLGNENITLASIIKSATDKKAARRIEERRHTINRIAKNIEINNTITTDLIKHAIKLVEGSIDGLAQALNTQNSELATYSNFNKSNSKVDSQLSSIIKEA